MRLHWFMALVASCAASSLSASAFGTKDEARAIAAQVIDIIEQDGIAAAAEAIIDPDKPYRKSRLGINLFDGTVVIADNREPESVATDYADFADLTGEPIWGRVSTAADLEDDAELRWYHYDTQEPYTFLCFVRRASRDNGMVMVCR